MLKTNSSPPHEICFGTRVMCLATMDHQPTSQPPPPCVWPDFLSRNCHCQFTTVACCKKFPPTQPCTAWTVPLSCSVWGGIRSLTPFWLLNLKLLCVCYIRGEGVWLGVFPDMLFSLDAGVGKFTYHPPISLKRYSGEGVRGQQTTATEQPDLIWFWKEMVPLPPRDQPSLFKSRRTMGANSNPHRLGRSACCLRELRVLRTVKLIAWSAPFTESWLNPGHPLPQNLEAVPEPISERLFY